MGKTSIFNNLKMNRGIQTIKYEEIIKKLITKLFLYWVA